MRVKNRIPVTLIEAAEQVDSGVVYDQDWLEFDGHELVDQLRVKQALATLDLCQRFVANYSQSLAQGVEQEGEESFYPRRRAIDSQIALGKSLLEQFNLLRVVDNNRYPTFFELAGHKYTIKVNELKSINPIKNNSKISTTLGRI